MGTSDRFGVPASRIEPKGAGQLSVNPSMAGGGDSGARCQSHRMASVLYSVARCQAHGARREPRVRLWSPGMEPKCPTAPGVWEFLRSSDLRHLHHLLKGDLESRFADAAGAGEGGTVYSFQNPEVFKGRRARWFRRRHGPGSPRGRRARVRGSDARTEDQRGSVIRPRKRHAVLGACWMAKRKGRSIRTSIGVAGPSAETGPAIAPVAAAASVPRSSRWMNVLWNTWVILNFPGRASSNIRLRSADLSKAL